MNGEPIYPPLYTKVMGRPKKNRTKAPEEKVKKGVTIITKAGTTIHCSVCGKAGHNKKGHNAYVNTQVEQMKQGIVGDDEDVDIPSILEVIYLFPNNCTYIVNIVSYIFCCCISAHHPTLTKPNS
jgi:hypothetical protein